MDDAELGQVAVQAATVYEDFFVPALFGQWPAKILDQLGVEAGMRVLDAGCGTGVLARTALPRVQPSGSVVGVDVNAAMLAVAASTNPEIDWVENAVEHLEFADGEFDLVCSQFALMFFADRSGGLAELSRVGKRGAPAGIATWAALELSPGYAAMVDLLDRLFGTEAAEALRAPFVLGDISDVEALVSEHFDDVVVSQLSGAARFESIDAWVHTDVRGWTLAEMIDDEQFDQLLIAARRELAPFAHPDGHVEFDAPALVAIGHCRGGRL